MVCLSFFVTVFLPWRTVFISSVPLFLDAGPLCFNLLLSMLASKGSKMSFN